MRGDGPADEASQSAGEAIFVRPQSHLSVREKRQRPSALGPPSWLRPIEGMSIELRPVAMPDLRVDLVLDDGGDEGDLDEAARQLRG